MSANTLEELLNPETTTPKKGVICKILRSCGTQSTGGISTRFNQVILVGKGVDERFEPDEEMPGVCLERLVYGKTIDVTFARPIGPEGDRCTFGGNYIMGSVNNGYPFDHPIKLHDRSDNIERTTDADRNGISLYNRDELIQHYPGKSNPTAAAVLEDIKKRWGKRSLEFLEPVDLALWQNGRLVAYVTGDLRNGVPPVFVEV